MRILPGPPAAAPLKSMCDTLHTPKIVSTLCSLTHPGSDLHLPSVAVLLIAMKRHCTELWGIRP